MFIELLIVLGILGILSAITVVAINPAKHLCDVRNAQRLVTARELTNAVNQYAIATYQKANAAVPAGEDHAKPICRGGVTNDPGCVNLDALVPEYVIALPVDASEANQHWSGYGVFRNVMSVDLDRVVPLRMEPCGAAR
jgi:type II secretory pathway pseudopilin PulG